MTRKDILDAALKCVNGDRDRSYGNPEDSFLTIARFWNVYLGARPSESPTLNSKDVAAMLALLKIARISGGVYKADNWIDLAGYAACGGEIEESAMLANAKTQTTKKNGEDEGDDETRYADDLEYILVNANVIPREQNNDRYEEGAE